ncbi:membrane associated rhomboid family serine protease [Actinoplanes octamycinicus]|uniref:Membrane associated rhomboid family serine protease n=1 Tax=Actinoplanes octamycinicus TaxID=135948 RepID=A0A7W7M551_9ACTN|nr:rhomboid family intramembrane serine protease [Actinoplanes octamycinicus]MBB4737432.1 membrane associated rhomboid family serine protease [Actinoplanes octamycinicus]GIE60283.1 rhomboid family intramembrane serine protease [Actinoplanes octamycinicus]
MSWAPDTRADAAARFGTEAFYASLGRAFVTMCAIIPILFLIEGLDVALGSGTLDLAGGIKPWHLDGLDGVLFSPFLHAGWDHLYGNAVPLILVGTFALAGGARRFIWSTLTIMLISGVGVWFIGSPDTVVVGASGVIFGYLGLLVGRGLVEHSWWNLAVAAFIGLLYWYQVYNILPTDRAVSWQGHLLGLIGGFVAAFLFRRR